MKALASAVVATILLSASAAFAAPSGGACDVPDVQYLGELQSILSRRAVEVVDRAAEAASDTRLRQLVEPTAAFSLGAGDVGRPLGNGPSGARALARAMKADSYRFLGWNFIPTPVEDRCGLQKVEVEFTDTPGGNVYPVTFTFRGGRLVAAEGWSRTFETGPVHAVP